MVNLVIYLIFTYAVISIIASPWFTAVAYFANGVMQPKYIWPWTFPSIVQSKFLVIITMLGLMKAIADKQVDYSIYRHKQNYMLLGMCVLMHLSHIFSPYPEYWSAVPAEVVLSTMNTIVITYFVGLGLLSHVDNYKKCLLSMAVMFALIAVYYSYWANDLYLSNRWDMFEQGRLKAPYGSSIGDQNALSCLVVMGMPFLLLGFFYCKNIFIKWSCLGVLPLLWNALFLWGSRGAMIGVLVTTLLSLRMLRQDLSVTTPVIVFKYVKMFKMMIVLAFIGAVILQGGAMVERSTETAADAQAGDGDEPLNPRLVSWSVGMQIAFEFPLLGAGPQRFLYASSVLFPGQTPFVAHNTFINFSANTGFPVGLLFLSLLWTSYKSYRFCANNGIDQYPILDYLNKSCILAFVSYAIGGMFLDLIIFQGFYFMLMIDVAKLHIFKKLISQKKDAEKQANNKKKGNEISSPSHKPRAGLKPKKLG